MQGNPVKGRIRFFLGYSGWEYEQLGREIEENTWLVGKENISLLMDEIASDTLWKKALCKLRAKYEIWSRFPPDSNVQLVLRRSCNNTTSLYPPPTRHHSFKSPQRTKPQDSKRQILASLSTEIWAISCFRYRKPKT